MRVPLLFEYFCWPLAEKYHTFVQSNLMRHICPHALLMKMESTPCEMFGFGGSASYSVKTDFTLFLLFRQLPRVFSVCGSVRFAARYRWRGR